MKRFLNQYRNLNKVTCLESIESWNTTTENVEDLYSGIVELKNTKLIFDPDPLFDEQCNIDELLKHSYKCMFKEPAQRIHIEFNFMKISPGRLRRLLSIKKDYKYLGVCMFVAMPHKVERVEIYVPNRSTVSFIVKLILELCGSQKMKNRTVIMNK